MKRFERETNHHQSEAEILRVLDLIRIKIFGENGTREQTIKLFHSAQNVRRDRKKSKSEIIGRKPLFKREFVLTATSHINQILEVETDNRISLARFVTAYLPILNYPPDLKKALELNRINIEEAKFLARIKKENLPAGTNRKSVEIRRELIESHIKRQGSQGELRRRVLERLDLLPKQSANQVSHTVTEIIGITDELVAWNALDTEHLFWEDIKDLVYLLRDVDTNLIDTDEQNDILSILANLKLRLFKYRYVPEE